MSRLWRWIIRICRFSTNALIDFTYFRCVMWLQTLDFTHAYSFANLVLIALVLTKITLKPTPIIYGGLDRGLIVRGSHLLWQASHWWRLGYRLYGRAVVNPRRNSFGFLSVRGGGMLTRDTEFEHYWPTWKVFVGLHLTATLYTP
jgi:hypothetical protein